MATESHVPEFLMSDTAEERLLFRPTNVVVSRVVVDKKAKVFFAELAPAALSHGAFPGGRVTGTLEGQRLIFDKRPDGSPKPFAVISGRFRTELFDLDYYELAEVARCVAMQMIEDRLAELAEEEEEEFAC